MTTLTLCALTLVTLLTYRQTVRYVTRARRITRRYTKERGRWYTWPPEQRGPHAYLCVCDVCEPEIKITDYNISFN